MNGRELFLLQKHSESHKKDQGTLCVVHSPLSLFPLFHQIPHFFHHLQASFIFTTVIHISQPLSFLGATWCLLRHICHQCRCPLCCMCKDGKQSVCMYMSVGGQVVLLLHSCGNGLYHTYVSAK